MKHDWSWDILIARCGNCKGLVELPQDLTLEEGLLRHLRIVHGIKAVVLKMDTPSSKTIEGTLTEAV